MRPFEVLLLMALVLSFTGRAIPTPRRRRWTRGLSGMALLLAIVQASLEGPRWQMLPAYALSAALALLAVQLGIRSTPGSVAWLLARRIAVGLGALALVLAFALPIGLPVFRFSPPTGPHAIGSLSEHWSDASRSEVFGAHPHGARQLMVQIWYPAVANPSRPRAAYLADADTVTAAFARLHGLPAFLFGHFRHLVTNAISGAAVASGQGTFPVLLFLEGATGFRQMNSYQVEELVSQGYIVVALDQPGAAATVVFPDRHQVPGLNPAQFRSAVGPSYLAPAQGATPPRLLLPNGRILKANSIVPYLAQDVSFALDELVALNRSSRILKGRLDLQRLAAFGVSLGGIAVGEACLRDPRLRVCLVMDAPMSSAVTRAGLQQPSLWITRDAASMRLERQCAGGWPEAEIEAHLRSMRAAYDTLGGAGYFVQVSGMFHSNFSDVPNWTPLATQLGLAGPIAASRGHEIVNAYSLAFFDRHLKGQPAALLDGPAARYPEVRFESRRPDLEAAAASPPTRRPPP
jgi:hypothetical protein